MIVYFLLGFVFGFLCSVFIGIAIGVYLKQRAEMLAILRHKPDKSGAWTDEELEELFFAASHEEADDESDDSDESGDADDDPGIDFTPDFDAKDTLADSATLTVAIKRVPGQNFTSFNELVSALHPASLAQVHDHLCTWLAFVSAVTDQELIVEPVWYRDLVRLHDYMVATLEDYSDRLAH